MYVQVSKKLVVRYTSLQLHVKMHIASGIFASQCQSIEGGLRKSAHWHSPRFI